MKLTKRKSCSLPFTLLSLLLKCSSAKQHKSLLRNQKVNARNDASPNHSSRKLQSTLSGTCTGSTLSPGVLQSKGSLLCYPMPSSSSSDDNVIYKFGIDSNNNLAYYVYNQLIWKAVIPNVEQSTACIAFGTCDDPPMSFVRLQNGGSLVGYDANQNKIWDSHEDIESNGEYSNAFDGDGEPNAIADKISGSSMIVNEEGVFIESEGGDVTWKVLSPGWGAPSVSPVGMPSASPVVMTAEPTKEPSAMPTGRPSARPTLEEVVTSSPTIAVMDDFVSVSGRVFLDPDEDGTASTSIVDNIVVDLYDCGDSNDPTWIIVTRTNSSGYYLFSNDDSSGGGIDLSITLAEMNITKFRAEFSGLPSGFMFSPALSGSDVNSDGQTACWDLDNNGRGSIVWNAGVMNVSISTEASTDSPINPRPSNPPTTDASSKPSSSAVSTSPTAKPTPAVGIIGGYAFLDSDGNGVRNPDTTVEPAMTNINVELFSCGNTASSFDDDTKLAIDRTNGQGLYAFRNLTSGYYRVNVEVPSGYVFSSIWSGNTNNDGDLTDPDVDSTVNPETGTTPCFRVIKGTSDLSWGFGLNYDNVTSLEEVPAPSPSSGETTSPSIIASSVMGNNSTIAISGFVFYDKDNNGYFEEGEEEAISNVDVALFDCKGNIVIVGSTDENGMYGFDNLKQGSYSVKFSLPSGYEFSNVWSGEENDEGDLISPDAGSDVDPSTGLSPCQTFTNSVYSLDAGMFLSDDVPSSKPTNNPKGDGTPCSGGKCPEEGMCRNVAGVCGSGLSFCNPQSVWTPECVEEKSNSPTLFPVTVVPTISSPPTLSQAPFYKPSPITMSVCNVDGTYGETTDGDGVKASEVTFQYTLLNKSGGSFDDAITQFEEELSVRLACHYFNDLCLNCGSRLRRRLSPGRKIAVQGSYIAGLSSKPKDVENLFAACADPQFNCRVMNGFMTAYFPSDTPLTKVISDKSEMLAYISDEIAKDNWGDLVVSEVNEPLQAGAAETEQENKNIGGFPLGAIIGIAVAGLVALVAIIALSVFFLRDKKAKEMERMQPIVIQQVSESHGSQYFDEDSDSDDSMSSEEDDMSGRNSSPSAVSGADSYPTTMAQAKPQDIEDDESSGSSSGTSSESDGDDDSGEYEVEEDGTDNVENLKTSASSDEAPPVYEQDDMGEYSHDDGFPMRYLEDTGDDQDYNFDRQQQQYTHDDSGDYNNQTRMFDDDGSGGSMGSMNSADPPGRSFRDLHQDEDDWNSMLPPPQSMAPHIVEDDFYRDNPPPVYESDEASNPESYHSNASRRSGRSNHSNHSNRSRSHENNQSSYHSFYDDDEYIGEVDQVSTGSRGRYAEHDYDEFDQQIEHVNSPDYDQNYVDPQYNTSPSPHDDQDSFYGHAQPVTTPSYSQQQDRLGDYGDDTTTYSESTRQVSNVRRASNSHQEEQLSEANFEPSYDEEEESISNIFKSLSEIQTKLAKKGKISSNGTHRHIPATNINNQQSRWSQEGLVEDASMDGSQMSSFETRASKSKRPQHGAWMEPVDEYDS